jgi:hypothetical protein
LTPLLIRLNRYLLHSRRTPSAFGLDVAGDPRLVGDMRLGRQPRPQLQRRIEAYLDVAEELERRKWRPR